MLFLGFKIPFIAYISFLVLFNFLKAFFFNCHKDLKVTLHIVGFTHLDLCSHSNVFFFLGGMNFFNLK